MQVLWNIAPWMRRRAQRHLERGSSVRVIQYILNSAGPEPDKIGEPSGPLGQPTGPNILLFRALKHYS